MPPRPFPFPINVGTDVCRVSRIARILTKSHDHARRFWERVLSPHEAKRDRHIFEMLYPPKLTRPPPPKTPWKNLELKSSSQLLAEKDEGNEIESLSATTPENTESMFATPSEETESSPTTTNAEGSLEPPMEKIECEKRPVLDNVEYENKLRSVSMFLAGRFAAKEAVMKAHHYRRLTWHDIEIEKSGRLQSNPGYTQPPYAIVFSGPGRIMDAAQAIPVSISHDGDYATASAIAMAHEIGSYVVRNFFKGLSDPAKDSKTTVARTNTAKKDLVRITKAFEFVADRLELLEEKLEKMESLEKRIKQIEMSSQSQAEPEASILPFLQDITPEEMETMIQEEQIIQRTVKGILEYTDMQQDTPRGSRKLLRVENLRSDLDQSQLEKLFSFDGHKLLNSWLCKRVPGNISIGVAFFQYDSPMDKDFPDSEQLDTIIDHLGENPVFSGSKVFMWPRGNRSWKTMAKSRKVRAVIAAEAQSPTNTGGKVRAKIFSENELFAIFSKLQSTEDEA
ncbi:hypothetical protein BGZ60DRAFT_402425 [Tricladium varicosporioides]|nr:hypothetical protein BGZ60DRAFT_402425 [Hymenoscyphus varicosporioides]